MSSGVQYQSMQLRPEKTLLLGLVDTYDNITGTASFLFRNLVYMCMYDIQLINRISYY